MKNNTKLFFLFFCVLLILSYFVMQNNSVKLNRESTYLVPELKTQINEVEAITIHKNNQKISLTKQSDTWRIIEANNYLADANTIANLLLNLRKFELNEMKTAKPENMFRLDLEEKGDNAGIRIKLRNSTEQFADIMIGKQAQNSQGMYVKKSNETQAWLSQGSVNIKLNPSDWILSTIIDVDISQVKSVSFKSANQEFTLDKITPQDADFGFVNLPEDYQLKQGVVLLDFANGLQKFTIENAKPRIEMDNAVLSVSYQLFSGMQYHLTVFSDEQFYYMNIDLVNQEFGSESDRQLQNWTYEIASFKFNALNKKPEDMIEPVTESNATENLPDDSGIKE